MPDPPARSYYVFDRVAVEYERTRFLPPEIADAAAEFFCDKLPATSWFLDAGVGTGRFGKALSRRHARTIGVDISRSMLAQMASGQRPYRVCADLRALPFPHGAFERILSVHVFHLIRDWQQALAEIWRLVAPGGTLYLARESRAGTAVREYYLRRAAEDGVLPERLGTQTPQLIATLEAWGGVSQKWEPSALRWRQEIPVRQTLDMLGSRTYSILWDMPETDHLRLLAETAAWAKEIFGDKAVEVAQNQVVILGVTKPMVGERA